MTLYERYITDDATNVIVAGIYWKAQTFTVGNTGANENHNVTSVKLLLYRYGLPGTITVSIRATLDGKPTGDDLAIGTTNGDNLPTGSPYEWREITFETPALLSTSTQYAIVVRALDAVLPARGNWRIDNTVLAYTGGTYLTSSDGDSTWDIDDRYDCMFEEYGEVAAGPETHTPGDTAKATDSPAFKLGIPLSDIAKASDSPAFKPKIPLSDTAKASDELTTKAGSVLSDIAKASDSIVFKVFHEISDTARAQDAFFPDKLTLSDVAKAHDSVTFSMFIKIETPTDDVQIFRNDLSL